MATPINNMALSPDDKDLQKKDTPQALPGSTQNTGGTGGSASAFSSGQQTPGSGRFTNIQNYIDANKGAGANLGARANDNLNKSFNNNESDVNKQNTNLQGQFGQGQKTLQAGNLFKNELSGIGSGLNTGFKSLDNKDVFDAAGQRAASFAQNGIQNNQGLDTSSANYQNIAQGKGIDTKGLTSAQQQALGSAQGLSQNVNSNLQGVETNQGRDKLFQQTIQPKQGYDPSQRNFDKLFLGQSLNGIRSNLSNQANQANTLVGSTAGQQQTLDQLTSGQNALADAKTGLYGMAGANQDTFNSKLGDRGNIDLVNQLRDDKYNDSINQLKTGKISQNLSDTLGLSGMNTYVPGQPASANPSTMGTASGNILNRDGSTAAFVPRNLRTYNTDLANTASTYLTQGRNAQNTQDIASDQDYKNYQALQNLAGGRDTGLLKGASTLDAATQVGKNANTGKTLAETINGYDTDFKNNYAGRNVTSLGVGTQSGPGGRAMQTGSYADGHAAGANGLGVQTILGDQDYGAFRGAYDANRPNAGKGSGATSQSVGNVDQFISTGGTPSTRVYDQNGNYTSSGGGINSSSAKLFDDGGDTNSNNQAINLTGADTESATRNKLNQIINSTGVKNQAQLVNNAELTPSQIRAKQLGRLV